MKTKDLTYIALIAALLCTLAPISIPTGGVSLSLATFVIYLTAYLLLPQKAIASVGLYLLLGAVGLPVFSGYTAGISHFAGTGGGYLLGYLFLAGISAFFVQRFSSAAVQLAGMAFATAILYLIGTVWLAFVTNTPFSAALPMGMFLFLPFDCIKMIFACILGRKLKCYI